MKTKTLMISALCGVVAICAIATPVDAVRTKKYVSGTCKQLLKKGIYDIPKGDPNYTQQRDRDNDGIACNRK